MERAQSLVQLSQEDAERVSELRIPSHQVHVGPSFYEDLALRGIRVDRVEPGRVSCTFTVPPRLLGLRLCYRVHLLLLLRNLLNYASIWNYDVSELKLCSSNIYISQSMHINDRNGSLAPGAIANLVDIVGNALIYKADRPMNVSVDISISYISTAKLHDELEVTSKLLGDKGLISGTSVVIKNKASGEVVAEGRHSLFRRPGSKL